MADVPGWRDASGAVTTQENVRPAPIGRKPPGGERGEARIEAVQSIVRALRVLNRLSEAEDGLPLTKLAQAVALAPSTAHRLLTTLEQERYVRFDAERRLWSIGVQGFLVGCAFLKTRDLIGVARPVMRTLVDQCRTTVNLAVQDGSNAIYVHRIERPAVARAGSSQGGQVPLFCSAVGKALLAGKSDGEIDPFLPEDMRRLTANTLISRSALRANIALTRERGFAVDDEERVVGLRCVAAPVFNEAREPIAAISISGPSTRISPEAIPQLGAMLRQAADGITSRLGGARP